MYTEEANLDKHQALDRFFAGIERRAFRMAEMATGSRDDALDILQDTMLTLAHKYSRRSEQEWPPLFYRILQNRINSWYRLHYRKNKLFSWFSRDDVNAMAGQSERAGDEPDRRLQSGETVTALSAAFQRLPLRQQQVIMLRVWEGFGVAQTATIMGCSEGSVKTHYSRAVHALREQLGEHWP